MNEELNNDASLKNNGQFTNIKKEPKVVSKRYEKIIGISLILSLILVISIFASSWFSELYMIDMIHNNGQNRTYYNNIMETISLLITIIPMVIGILCIIFNIVDKKENKNCKTGAYDAFIITFIFTIIIESASYLSPFVYSITGLIYALKNKNKKFIIILSSIVLLLQLVVYLDENNSLVRNIRKSILYGVINENIIKDYYIN